VWQGLIASLPAAQGIAKTREYRRAFYMTTSMTNVSGRLGKTFAILFAFFMVVANRTSLAEQKNASCTSGQSTITFGIRTQPASEYDPVLEYQVLPNPRKPYVKRLLTPSGINVLRDSPDDHRHHHGLMFAVSVDGVDFWSESDNCGRQISPQASREASGQVEGPFVGGATGFEAFGHFTHLLNWMGPGNQPTLLQERRTIWVHAPFDVAVTLMTWRCRLSPPPGKDTVTLTGSPYFGLGIRFVPSMDTGGQFHNADGATGVKGTNAAHSKWCAYTASANGTPVTVAVFDDKINPRHPATWFTMEEFAYLSATLNLHKQPIQIDGVKPLDLRYGVALWDGKVGKAQIDKLYKQWLDLAVLEEADD